MIQYKDGYYHEIIDFLGFLGYSGILNAGKFGITGFNISATSTQLTLENSTFYSPSFTAFYTKPIIINKKLEIFSIT